jgi:phage gpG-like protein
VVYAATHQFGRDQGSGKIPARPFFPVTGVMGSAQLTPAAEAKIAAAGQRALAQQI